MALFKNRKVFIFILLVIGLVGVLLAGLQSESNGNRSQTVVRTFPVVSTTLLSGQSIESASSLLDNEYQLVNVWASWCGICKSEHSYLMALAESGVPIIGLNYRDQQLAATGYLKDAGNPYDEIIYDPKGQLSIELGVVGTPETYLVNASGEVIYKHYGKLTEKAWQTRFARYFEQDATL